MEYDERSVSLLLYNIILNDIANGREQTATKFNSTQIANSNIILIYCFNERQRNKRHKTYVKIIILYNV